MWLLVWQHSRSEQQLDGILFSGSATARITVPWGEAHLSFHGFTCHSATWNIHNYLSDPLGRRGPSRPGGLELLAVPFLPAGQEIPVLEAPLALLCPGGLAVQENLGRLGPRLHDPPGNVCIVSQLPAWESPWTQSSHCHKLTKHLQKAHNSRRQGLNGKSNFKWLT